MRESYGGSGETRHGGYHSRERRTPNEGHGGSGQGRMEPNTQGRAGMKEPTNHAGHTYDMGKTHAHSANVEAMRNAHAGKGQHAHQKILHETHKLHQTGDFNAHGNSKHGEAHHYRGDKDD